MFELRYHKRAEKYFRKLKEKGLKEAYRIALRKISEDPYQGNLKSVILPGYTA
jgi:mRNA interferase RelE/StbE